MVIRLSEVQFIIMVIGSNGVQFIMVIKLSRVQLIMVIGPSGVQFIIMVIELKKKKKKDFIY